MNEKYDPLDNDATMLNLDADDLSMGDMKTEVFSGADQQQGGGKDGT